MKGSPELHDVVGAVYEAALAPQLWPSALENLADITGSCGAALLFQDQVTGTGSAILARIDPGVLQHQFGYYATRNPVRPGRNRRLGLSRSPVRWRSRVVTDEEALPKPELMRTEYYNDFLRPFGIHSGLMIGVTLAGTTFGTINLLRSRRGGPFDQREIGLARQLQPHLIRACAIDLRLSEARQLSDSLSQSLDRSPHGIFVVDADARVRHANSAGESLAAGGHGLMLRDGILRGAGAESTRMLHRLIKLASERDAERRKGGAMSLERPGFRRPLSVVVAPLTGDQRGHFRAAPSAIVFATAPERGQAAPADRLRALFGFTAAEAGVAVELLAGRDLATIAGRRSVSVNTIRVHVARMMAKTDTNRQAELVRLLESVSSICTE
ncbi:MAG TPA: LuxR C-terminal-related transcriptional regulator [Rhizomicrobium sp.]|nr:LuxR C-terminal-related transcriptional regulator [Rhizomicrobium sp.]